MFRNRMTTRVALTLGFAVFSFACTDETNDDGNAEEVGDTDAGETEVGETEVGESDSTDSVGTEDTDTQDSDTQDSATDDTSTDDTGPGELPSVEEACADSCATFADCGIPLPTCEQLCVDAHSQFEGECLEAELAWTVCMADLSCEDLNQVLLIVPGTPGTPCEEEGQALCSVGCEGFSSPSEPGCSVEMQCGDLPLHTVECDDEECVCAIEGQQVGSCPVDDAVCDMDEAAIDACCGWQLSDL